MTRATLVNPGIAVEALAMLYRHCAGQGCPDLWFARQLRRGWRSNAPARGSARTCVGTRLTAASTLSTVDWAVAQTWMQISRTAVPAVAAGVNSFVTGKSLRSQDRLERHRAAPCAGHQDWF